MIRWNLCSGAAATALLPALVLLAGCADGPLGPDLADLEPSAPSFSTQNTLTGDPQFSEDVVFPSTNEANLAEGWAHVRYVDVGVGTVTLEFVSMRGFASCFEYRSDEAAPTDPRDNFNGDVTDGLWPFVCTNNSTELRTLSAGRYVDVRLAFGAEGDERFNWTRFYVLSPDNKDQCRDGDWQALGFRNQGQCVRFVETGKDSR